MNADALVQWLFDGAVATSAALLLVLALRLPLRRAFGARIAYAAWALVPLALLAVTLPAPRATTALLRALPALRPAVTVGAPVPLDGTAAAASTPLVDWPLLLASAWCLGAALLALRFAAQQRRYLAALGELRPRGDGTFAADAGQSPAVIGAWRPRIVLPADFDARYPGGQAALVVAHERVHVRRGDVRANLAVAVLRCLHWFNPLLHAAAARFRLDQELACDAAVLARHPHARRAYADAMLNTQLAVPGLPVGCHWQSSQSLKERILMLKKPLPGRARRSAGLAVLVVALAAGSYGAWALQPADRDQAPALIGSVIPGQLAVVDIREERGAEPIVIMGGAMGNTPGYDIQAFMDTKQPLSISIGKDAQRIEFEARVTGSEGNAAVDWTLSRAGRRIDQGRLQLAEAPKVLTIGGPARGLTSLVTLAFREQTGSAMVKGGAGTPGLRIDDDGGYTDVHGGGLYSLHFKQSGTAYLLLHVSPLGIVQKVDIERVVPAGAFTDEDARSYVRDMRFSPRVENGKPVASLVRTKVEFAAAPPAVIEPTAGTRDHGIAPDGNASVDIRSKSAAPPKYPADAVAKRITGKVVLVIDVAADGSVTNARVEKSEPAGVFDQVTLDAVKSWTFEPAVKEGKPVAGRVRVPVTFDIPPGSEPMKVGPDVNPGVAAYEWIKFDPAVDRGIRGMECKVMRVDSKAGVSYCGVPRQTASTP